jgi:hypothetical protein
MAFSCGKKSSIWDTNIKDDDSQNQDIDVNVTVEEETYSVLEPYEGTLNANESKTIKFKEDDKFIAKIVEVINDSETDDLVIWFNGASNKRMTVKKNETRVFSQKEFESITLKNNSSNAIPYRITAQGDGI